MKEMRRLLLASLAFLPLVAADVPRTAPEFTVRMTNGKDIQLSEYKGKVVVVEFLLTTCPHCQRASQALNRVYRELGPRGLQPIGVAMNEMAHMRVEEYVKQFNLDFPVGWSPREPAIAFLEHPVMLMLSFPNLVIIDREGKIQRQIPGGDPFFANEEQNLRDAILPLLGPAPKSRSKKR